MGSIKSNLKFLLLFGLTCVVQTIYADEIFKCSAKGSTTYQSTPCKNNAKQKVACLKSSNTDFDGDCETLDRKREQKQQKEREINQKIENNARKTVSDLVPGTTFKSNYTGKIPEDSGYDGGVDSGGYYGGKVRFKSSYSYGKSSSGSYRRR